MNSNKEALIAAIEIVKKVRSGLPVPKSNREGEFYTARIGILARVVQDMETAAAALPSQLKQGPFWACNECGSSEGFTPHTDWETGLVDDVKCNECGSMSTGEVVEVLREMAQRVAELRAQAAALPSQPEQGPVAESYDRMAYEGAREDLLDWKRRALKAEEQPEQGPIATRAQMLGEFPMDKTPPRNGRHYANSLAADILTEMRRQSKAREIVKMSDEVCLSIALTEAEDELKKRHPAKADPEILAALRDAHSALTRHHEEKTSYSRGRAKANATCGEFKENPLAALIESGYMHGEGKIAIPRIERLTALLAKYKE